MFSVATNIARVRERVQAACATSRRDDDTVLILAVSKTKPVDDIRAAYSEGLRHFGENYVQELVEKATTLQALDIIWHFIGPLQSNKTRSVAEMADWVHSIDRFKIAKRLSEQRPANTPDLNVLIQVNLDEEETKSGVKLEEVEALVSEISRLERISLRGLMAIPRPDGGDDALAQSFAKLKTELERLQPRFPTLDTLSMGMSKDLELAISQGSTIVRIGTDIFGTRAGQ